MKVKITLTGPGGELDSVLLNNLDGETDDRISEAVAKLATSDTLAVGDTITITEIE